LTLKVTHEVTEHNFSYLVVLPCSLHTLFEQVFPFPASQRFWWNTYSAARAVCWCDKTKPKWATGCCLHGYICS